MLYTTHYMEEAERLCDRIGIIDHGRLMAEGTRAELVALVGERDRVRLDGSRRPGGGRRALPRAARASARPSARDGAHRPGRRRRAARCCPSCSPTRRRPGVDRHVASRSHEPDLEAVFLHLTGKALRDWDARGASLIAGKDLRQRLRDRSALLIGARGPARAGVRSSGSIFHDVGSGRIRLPATRWSTPTAAPSAQASPPTSCRPSSASGLLAVRREATVAEARRAGRRGHAGRGDRHPGGLLRRGRGRTARARCGSSATSTRPSARRSPASIARLLRGAEPDPAVGRHRGRRPRRGAPRRSRRSPRGRRGRRARWRSTTSPPQTKQLDATTFFAAGMAVFFLFFTVQFGVTSLLEERNDGTLARLLAAPISRALDPRREAADQLRCSASSAWPCSRWPPTLLFGAHWGNPLGVALLIVAGVLAATGIMALVATLARTPSRPPTGVGGRGHPRACSAARSSRSPRRPACCPRSACRAPGVVPARARRPPAAGVRRVRPGPAILAFAVVAGGPACAVDRLVTL